MRRLELCSDHDVPIQEFVPLQRFLAVILATSCGNSMSSRCPVASRGLATGEWPHVSGFGMLGSPRKQGGWQPLEMWDAESIGSGGFPPWLDQPLCTPSSLFLVPEKGIGNLGPLRNPQHCVLNPYKPLHFPPPVKPYL